MRTRGTFAIVGLVVVIAVAALAPTALATATPVRVWPAEEFVLRSGAPNFTAWAVERLGLDPDPGRTPGWTLENFTFPPAFAAPHEKYTEPFLGGNITAWYTKVGLLHSLGVSGATAFVAQSLDIVDLERVANRVAAALDIAIDFTGAGVVIPGPALPPEQRFWFLEIDSARLEFSGDFYSATAEIRETDRRLVGFSVSIRYRVAGTPDLSGPDAIAVAFDFARSAYNASAPSGDLGRAYVVNGSSFAYEVYVFWAASSPDLLWFMRVWIDANSGATVEVEGPRLQPKPVEGGGPGGFPAWPLLVGVLVAAAVLLSLLFFRLVAARALDHFTRGQIYGYVTANPGAHYTAIREALGLSNGTLEYHLWVLQRSGFIRSVKQGRLRRVFPEAGGVRQGSVVLSRLQYSILDVINESGPLPRAEIARRLGISRQRGHYNIKVLTSLSLVEADTEGRARLSIAGANFVSAARTPQGAHAPVPS